MTDPQRTTSSRSHKEDRRSARSTIAMVENMSTVQSLLLLDQSLIEEDDDEHS
jgi:hypothetical protein